jgi:hypothetical protein
MKKITTLSAALILIAGCSSNGGENLTDEQKSNMSVVKWRSSGIVFKHTGLRLISIDGKKVGGGEYWVTSGRHEIKYACGRWQSEAKIDGKTFSEGTSQVYFKAGEAYFLAGKRSSSAVGESCSVVKFTYDEAKKKSPSIAFMFI